jgi:MFS family permease
MSSAHGWGRDVFALALAIQMLLWGAAQPLAGAVADRYGAAPVLSIGAVLYALGLASMAYAATPGMLHLTAGAVIGFGLAGSSFTIVIGAFGKLMPAQWRSLAFGAGTAAGSFGQFLFSPLAVAQRRLGGHARHLRRGRASHHAAVARARITTADGRACGGE